MLALLASMVPAGPAEAQSRQRPRVIFDLPPDRVVRIGRVGQGFTLDLDVPFHTTGDLRSPQVTVWSRGVITGVVSGPIGPVTAFSPSLIVVRATAPPRVPPGPYSVSIQVADRATGAREIFRSTILVEAQA